MIYGDMLIVIDVQNDFTSGALGNTECTPTVARIIDKIRKYRRAGKRVFFSKDTHFYDYLNTQEGKNLPVPHCIRGTWGWQIDDLIMKDEIAYPNDDEIICKDTFGTTKWLNLLPPLSPDDEAIEVVGFCTDICVVTNALILKTQFPEIKIVVDANCCWGTTKEAHDAALKTMKSCQVDIKE